MSHNVPGIDLLLDALPLPENIILCAIDVGLYPNILHENGLVAIQKALDAQEDKTVSTDALIELAEYVLKNNIFEHNTFLQTIKRDCHLN